MSRLWIYVFCSFVVRASPDVRSSLGNLHKIEDVLPSDEGICNRTEETLRTRSVTDLLLNTLQPITKPGKKLVSELTSKASEIVFVSSADVCYEELGCFAMTPPWFSFLRPIGEPMNPEEINASVAYYSRENMEPSIISLYPTLNLENITFNPSRATVFIVHGFTSSAFADWVQKLKTTYLGLRDVNMFAVNWADGAQKWNYFRVVANTRVVGRELGLLIQKLIKDFGATAKNFHLIGHSLGAHICSYAAKEVGGIGRITALDPAQPAFEGFNKEVRLDRSDAEFVEVLHTDTRPVVPTLGFGMITPHGHVDFYVNGGLNQPGCLIPKVNKRIYSLRTLGKIPVDALSDLLSCSHIRSQEYFIEALSTSECTFWGRRVHIFESLELTANFLTQGLLSLAHFTPCSEKECIPMNLDSVESSLRGSFVVFTRNSPPFCIH